MHKYTFILKIFRIFAPENNQPYINIFFNMKTNLLKIVGLAIIAIAYSSCSKTDFIDEQNEAIASQQRDDYVANFIKKYGPVDPNKSWDMASMQPDYSFTPAADAAPATTRGTRSVNVTKGTGFKVEQNVLAWCFNNIPAGKDNTNKGKSFYVTVPENSFTIVPIFQGTASYYWELWMHVEGVGEIQVWKKGDNLGYRTAAGGALSSPGTSNAGIAKAAYEVEAPTYTFSGLPQGASMYYYLKSWNSVSAYNNDADKTHYNKLTSLNQMMISLNATAGGCPVPAGVPAGYNVTIIGCEDNDKTTSDHDFEDLVFMSYGLPPSVDPEEYYSTITKRYMLEDLGSTDDFDFNDIVVDVSQESKTTITYKLVNGVKTKDNETTVVNRQWAEVRAAGGTLDFTISIGSSSWNKKARLSPVETMRNTGWEGATINYNAVLDQFEISNKDWVPSANNITVTVDGRGRNLGVQEIKFPKEGEIPLIIAVDKTEKWMVERQSVPDSWIQN